MDQHKKTARKEKTAWWNKDVYLNVSPKEAYIRLVAGVALPISIAWLRSTAYIIIISVVSCYLFISSLMLFCFVKYCWRHYILKKADPKVKDPDMPVEKL